MFKKTSLILSIILCSSIVFAAKSAKEYVNDLSSTDSATLMEAIKWVGTNQEKTAVAPLLSIVKSSAIVDARMEAAVSLGLIEEKSASDELSEDLLVESNANVRYSIVLAITRLGITSQKALENIVKAKDQETDSIIKDYFSKLEEKLSKK